jgi:hypothetical protein
MHQISLSTVSEFFRRRCGKIYALPSINEQYIKEKGLMCEERLR